jgi:hypothetical protein
MSQLSPIGKPVEILCASWFRLVFKILAKHEIPSMLASPLLSQDLSELNESHQDVHCTHARKNSGGFE